MNPTDACGVHYAYGWFCDEPKGHEGPHAGQLLPPTPEVPDRTAVRCLVVDAIDAHRECTPRLDLFDPNDVKDMARHIRDVLMDRYDLSAREEGK